MVGPGIPGQPCADGSEVCVEPQVRGDENSVDRACPQRNNRTSHHKSWADKKLPSHAPEKLPLEAIAGLLNGQLKAGRNSIAVYVVVYVAMNETSSNLIGIFFQEELSAYTKCPAAVVGKKASDANSGSG